MIKTIVFAICYLIYPFSFLFQRKKNKWAFGSFRGAFNDNAKYLYIYIAEHHPDINAMWISNSKETVASIRKKGLRAYYTYSVQGAWNALTSKFWFFNAYTSDIMFCLSGGVTAVNLWHGVGLKKIEFNIKNGPLAKRYVERTLKERFFHPESFRSPDFFISSAPFQTSAFSTAFRVPIEKCLELGYPRNMVLTMNEQVRKAFINCYESTETKCSVQRISAGYDKVFIYMPTWRDSQRDLFTQNFDLRAMDELMRANNALMILKPHVNTKVDSSTNQTFTNILFMDARVDVYTVLPYTDVLITDYSSVLYDYILMKDKDVILYLYDYAEYVKDRDFFAPFDENVVGKKVSSFTELCNCISMRDHKIDEKERLRIIEKFWGESAKMESSEEIVGFVRQLNNH